VGEHNRLIGSAALDFPRGPNVSLQRIGALSLQLPPILVRGAER
jgi:hypothetical protein